MVEFIREAIWSWTILHGKDIFMGSPGERIETQEPSIVQGLLRGRTKRETEVVVYDITNYLAFS